MRSDEEERIPKVCTKQLHKVAVEARQVCEANLEGYQDAIAGRLVEFQVDLPALMRQASEDRS